MEGSFKQRFCEFTRLDKFNYEMQIDCDHYCLVIEKSPKSQLECMKSDFYKVYIAESILSIISLIRKEIHIASDCSIMVML